ncbi:O-succinylbenzoic acid--CoA ligase [Serinicoccus hydrothermalis]|uniref:O-succinylbenzoic acid--CoA ligase n=1 Tax=Serinicoccus hydrothermalis TaxID=1758689 RepID=A0A1B1NBJ2_9MICO|nr:O-succinylbenzoic acid--CoA ligase [Serinicoccus hydrothermalis]
MLGEPLRALLRDDANDGAVVVATSGSSGTPKRVRLGAAALRASGAGTAQVLGGHGQWLLALPTAHVAGLQVLARSALAGTEPVELDPDAPFTAGLFAAAVARMDQGARRYASLVPTQLQRALAEPQGADALRRLNAVLVGGAASDPGLLDAARSAGVRVVTTYGMSETCGGCVYDGIPLPGVEVDLGTEDEGAGRIRLGGPVLADGYVDDPDLTRQRFVTDDGRRWFVTDDRGADRDGRLTVLGRLDDVIVSGGHKVEPRDVETALRGLPQVQEVLVVGIPDPEWGERVAALVVLRADARGVRSDEGVGVLLREALRERGDLPSHALPRQVETVGQIPLLATGKPDRTAARHLLTGGGRMGSSPIVTWKDG